MNGNPPKWLVWAAAAIIGGGGTGWTISSSEDIATRVGKLEAKMDLVLEKLERMDN